MLAARFAGAPCSKGSCKLWRANGGARADIFLSYASKDAQRVEVLRDALTTHGFSVFWDQDIPPAIDWDTWIRQRLAESRCAIVVWTFQSIKSKNVRHEAKVAETRGKLISVLLDGVPPHDLPMGFYTVEAVDLSAWSGDIQAKQYAKLVHWLESELTPAWVRTTLEGRDYALSSERTRREVAESQVRLLRDQVARETVDRERLQQERDDARAELATLLAATEHGQSQRPDDINTVTTDPLPVHASMFSEEECRSVAIDRLVELGSKLADGEDPTTRSVFEKQPPLLDLIERGWGQNYPFLGWRPDDLNKLCIVKFGDKFGQCNWSAAQLQVLPGVPVEERREFALKVASDLMDAQRHKGLSKPFLRPL